MSTEEYRYAIEFEVAYDDPVVTETIYVSDGEFITSATDTPASTPFESRICDPGKIGLHAYSDGRVGGGTKLETGAVRLRNEDGRFDAWIAADYSVDGREIVIRRGKPSWDYPADWTTIFIGLLENFELTEHELVLNLRDPALVFDKPVCTAIYAGNNVLPLGVEGTEDDLKGRHKPMLYGTVTRVRVPCVNTAKLIYQISHGPADSHGGVEDRGKALTVMAGPDYPSLQSMYDNEPDPGYFRALLSPSAYFRLGATPDGEITWSGTYTPPDPAATLLLASVGMEFGVSATLTVDEDIVIEADVSTGSKLSFGVEASLVLDGISTSGAALGMAFGVTADVIGADAAGNGIDFNNTVYLLNAAGPGALAASKKGVFFACVRIEASDNSGMCAMGNDSGLQLERSESAKKWRIIWGGLRVDSTSTYDDTSGWRCVLATYDTSVVGGAACHLYVNEEAGSVLAMTLDQQLVWDTTNWTIGARNNGANTVDGCIAVIAAWHDQWIDITDAGNRRKFYSADGVPANMGVDGSTPLGVAATFYHKIDSETATDFITERGSSSGTFSAQGGSLTICATSPFD